MQLKKFSRKGFQLYVAHILEPIGEETPRLEDYQVLQEFKDVFIDEIPRPPSKKGHWFHNWTCARSSTSVQDTLQDEYARDARVEDVATRVVGKEVYLTKCVSFGSTGSVCEEERWYTQVMYWLQIVEQGYCEK